MYSIIWKYTIKSEHRLKFEHEYGSSGSWNKLFTQSKAYLGSVLHKSEDEIDTYLLIDQWADRQSYSNFLKANNEIYQQLSSNFEFLYLKEDKMGEFSVIS